jgi:TatD DNase family protein
MLADAHIHLACLLDRDPSFPERIAARGEAAGRGAAGGQEWTCCAASHDAPEWEASEALRLRLPPFVASFGIHPQWAVWKNADLLASLCAEGRIAAIGEAGFDFFGDRPERVRNLENESAQRAVFEYQLGLAHKHGLPILLHLRKAMDLAFEYAPELKNLPAAVFHSFTGSPLEAESLLKRGVNAYFSFGAPILNGNKRAAAACAAVPADRLLAETDAPWQPPRAEAYEPERYCRAEDIEPVLAGIAILRGISAEEAKASAYSNFARAYDIQRSEACEGSSS